MRTNKRLKSIEEVGILLEWLYSDEKNKVTIQNAKGMRFELRMTDDYQLMLKSLSKPHLPEIIYQVALQELVIMIKQLKTRPCNVEEFKHISQWSYIKGDLERTKKEKLM